MPRSTKEIWLASQMAPVEIPIGLSRIDSEFCWRDPLVELDEGGQGVVIHREVTWNRAELTERLVESQRNSE